MSDGSLSQDEIDALLQETDSLEIDTAMGGGGEPLSEQEKEQFLNILNEVAESQASNLNILIRKNVALGKPVLELKSRDELAGELPEEVIEVKLDFSDGIKGEHSYLLTLESAVSIAGSMIGQPGVEIDDAALSAVAEAMSQISGTASTEIGNRIDRTVKTNPPDFRKTGKEDIRLPQGDNFVKLEYSLTLEGEAPTKLIELYSLSVVKEIAALSPGGGGGQQVQAGAGAAQVSPGGQADIFGGGSAQPPGFLPGQTFGQPVGGQALGLGTGQSPPNVQPVQFANLQSSGPAGDQGNIGLLMDVFMEMTVELGRTKKLIREILGIGEGTIIELDKLAGEPVDILVNHKLIAKGEVVVIDENFGVRVTEIVSPMERMSDLT
jgi:flagellar motor switch protein FliN/FliY